MSSSIEIKFEAKDIIHAVKLQQQIVAQMRPLGYEFGTIETKPIFEKNKIQAKIILVYQTKKRKKKQ